MPGFVLGGGGGGGGGMDPGFRAFQQRFGRLPNDEVEFQTFMGTLQAPQTVSSQALPPTFASQAPQSVANPPQFLSSVAAPPQFTSSQPDFGPAVPFGQPQQPQQPEQPRAQREAESVARDRVRLGGGKSGSSPVPLRDIALSLGSKLGGQAVKQPKTIPGLGGAQAGGGIAGVMAEQARLDALSEAEAKRNTTNLITGILAAALGGGGGLLGGGRRNKKKGISISDHF